MKISSRPIALLLLACLGLAARSSAAETSPGPGLLGTSYCGASYVWHNFAESTLDASGFALEANWPVRANLDLTLSFDQWDTDSFFGLRARQQTFLAGLRLYSEGKTRYFLSADAGQARAGFTGFTSDTSLVYRIGTGAECKLSEGITVTPFVYGEFYNSGGSSGALVYGLKANAWLGRHLALTAGAQRNDDGDMSYRLGLNVRF